MFDSKKYHREYMRIYRTKPVTEEQRLRRSLSSKKSQDKQRANDPVAWKAKQAARGRAYRARKFQDPSVRKAQYKKHAEWVSRNRERVNAKQREWARSDKYRTKAKQRTLRKKYGMTLEEYAQRRASQDQKCPICFGPLGRGAVDHDHETGYVRDIICRQCNCWIGFIEKNPNLVFPMQQYLAKWSKLQKRIKQTA